MATFTQCCRTISTMLCMKMSTQDQDQLKQKQASKWAFPLPTVSSMDSPEQTAGSATCFLWWDWDGQRGRERCCILRPVYCHISVETADGRYVSCFCLTWWLPGTWPLPYTQTQHIHGHTLRAQTHTLYQAVGIYLCDELILSYCVDPASVTFCRPLWKPLNFAANQLSRKHTYTIWAWKYFQFRNTYRPNLRWQISMRSKEGLT